MEERRGSIIPLTESITQSPVQNISPIDGRYYNDTKILCIYFSEWALMRYRIYIEIEYLIKLNKTGITEYKFTDNDIHFLRNIHSKFDIQQAKKVKTIEAKTNHDVKAIEYYLKEKIKEHNFFEHKLLKDIGILVHFGLTSQDINSSSYMLSMKDSIETVIEPQLDNIFNILLFHF